MRHVQEYVRVLAVHPGLPACLSTLLPAQVRELMGTTGETLRRYISLFAEHRVRALTLHYLDAQVGAVV